MRQFVNGYLYKVAIGIGLVVLVGLVAADIWLWQSGDSGSSNQGTSSEQAVPGLPSRGDGSPSSNASASDSADLEIERGVTISGSDLIAGDGASVSDSFSLETTGSTAGSVIADGASLGDSAETVVEAAPPPPSGGGGPTDQASFGDTADLVVRDVEGNIKLQEEVK